MTGEELSVQSEASNEDVKLSAAEKRKLRRKKGKDNKKELKAELQKVHKSVEQLREQEQRKKALASGAASENESVASELTDADVVIEYVSAPLEGLEELKAQHEASHAVDPYAGTAVNGLFIKSEDVVNPYTEFERLVQHFGTAEAITADPNALGTEDGDGDAVPEAVEEDKKKDASENEGGTDSDEEEMSRKKRKHELRMGIATLKAECARPEVVEVWDVTAQDPKLLVYLKAYRNTVPVPRHWSQKRKFLQGKRGLEKPPFELPSFIQTTGVGEMRNAQEEQVEEKMKNKGRNRMRPKMGKMDIDYNVLHNAFFKYQEKPKLTRMGDLYYEGKEFEMAPSDAYPGVLSQELRDALGMMPNAPPPWLLHMQHYGPPPSYPSLKIPGLNAPIPPGAEFGHHPGGWGMTPVDEFGKPIYGDVFGEYEEQFDDLDLEVKTKRWGEMEDEESSEDEEDSDEEAPGLTQAQLEDGIASGMLTGVATDVTTGIATDHALDLRKNSGVATATGPLAPPAGGAPQLYTVLQEQAAAAQDSGLMAVSHTYAMPGGESARPADPAARKRLEMLQGQPGAGQGSVDVAMDPEELAGMNEEQLRQVYNSQTGVAPREDYSDMLASHAAAKKRKLQEQASNKAAKKAKDSFKF